MSRADKEVCSLQAADQDPEAIRRDADRWRYYAPKVSALLGISLEEMTKEIDEAIESEKADVSIISAPKF